MNTHPSRTRTALLLGLPGLAAVGVVAAPSLTSAAGQPVITCGTVVTDDVRLTHDLLDCPGPGIVVGASQITIDLAGHVVDGTGSGAGVDVSGGYDDLRITGGTVREFQFGIHLFETSGARVDHVAARSNTIGVIVERSAATELDGVTAADNAFNGIEVTFSERIAVRRSVAADNDHGGIFDVASRRSRYERNTVTGNVAPGVALWQSDRPVVALNRVAANESTGIELTGVDRGVLRRNQAVGNNGDGISIDEPGSTVTRNRAVDNDGVGISAPDGTIDRGGNRASGNLAGDCTGVRCG